ncbi:Meckelin (Transmembrane protein 67) [Nesidiocoris tenuis]|uniref:Meckelin (Transmembrane protein 67) n=1 Tax=Nesidiocoris tenuis TaxID=355587 RepID=A0ABN7BA14_9HEMI|nr:Meckelin (Transmembrane protein 67) [Nesidiocoris tenuis]
MVFNLNALVFCVICSVELARSDLHDIYNLTAPILCEKYEFFNVVTLKCEKCDTKKFQVPSEDRLSCACNDLSIVKSYDPKGQPWCTPCPAGSYPTLDKRACIRCKEANTSTESQKCECPDDSITVERSLNGTKLDAHCAKCSPGTKPSYDRRRCIPCSLPGTNCTCTSRQYLAMPNNECAESKLFTSFGINQESIEIEYQADKIDSPLFADYLRYAAYGCKISLTERCEFLANMCVMSMYQDTIPGGPCKILKDLRKLAPKSTSIPWIYYPEGEAPAILNKRKVQTKYTMMDELDTSYVNIVLSKWSLNGTWLGYSEGFKEFQLCPTSKPLLRIRYLADFQQSCNIPIKDLLSNDETYFYDVYVKYDSNNQTTLQSIPLLNMNYKMRKKYSNRLDMAQWQLTKRAFVLENANALHPKKNVQYPVMLRYLKSVVLRFVVRSGSDPGVVQLPLMILSYGEVLGDDVPMDKQVPVSFKVEFIGPDSVKRNTDISFAVLCSLSSVWSLIRAWAYIRRSGHRAIDLVAVLHLCIIACGHLANVFFFVVSMTAVQSFVYYKWQAVPHSFLPSARLHYNVRTYIIVAFPLKIMEMLNMMWHHLAVDIFLIDWEQPRVQKQTIFSVSAWRTYFVANKWLEIQTIRKTSILLQLCSVIFVLKVCQLEHWALKEPGTKLSSAYVSEDKVFRFAVSFIVYILIYVGQLLFLGGLYERYIKNFIQEFVDICSLANISVFVLALENYGFYIHGRSAHGFSDTDMATLRRHLRREEEDMVAHRGLVPASDHQTFQIHIPQKLRVIYKSFFNKIAGHRGVSRLLNKKQLKGGSGGGSGDSVMLTYVTINRFLAAFIEHALKDLDYEVKDKLFIEALLDIELFSTQEKGVFFNDNGHSFDNVLYYGNELTLFTFDIILFSFIEILSQNSLLAAILTLLFDEGIARIRKFFSRKNLARKALIDEYFLL